MAYAVAGTIIEECNGRSRFLVMDDEALFFNVPVQDELTNMGSLLEGFKQAGIEISKLELIELVTVKVDDKRMPMYVFLTREKLSIPTTARLISPDVFRNHLNDVLMTDIPTFLDVYDED